eukprot:1161839-Pelagomonas_calceolata.AAC.2
MEVGVEVGCGQDYAVGIMDLDLWGWDRIVEDQILGLGLWMWDNTMEVGVDACRDVKRDVDVSSLSPDLAVCTVLLLRL